MIGACILPDTPVFWLGETVVNTVTSGNQGRPQIVQMPSGEIRIVWESDDPTAPGNPAGIDLITRTFTLSGVASGPEELASVNAGNNENNADLAPFPIGQYLMVYETVVNGVSEVRLVSRLTDLNGSPASSTI